MIDFKSFASLQGLAKLTGFVRLLYRGSAELTGVDLLTKFREDSSSLAGVVSGERLAQIEAGLTIFNDLRSKPDVLRDMFCGLFEAREQVIERLGISRPIQEPNETLIGEVFAELGASFRLSGVTQEEDYFWSSRTFKATVRHLSGEPAAVATLIFDGSVPDFISGAGFFVEPKFQGKGLGMTLFQRRILLALELASVSTIHVRPDGDGISAWVGLAGLTATGPLHYTVDLRNSFQVAELLRSTETRRQKRDFSPPSAIAQKWFERYAV